MKKTRIITNDRKYKIQRLRTFFGIPLYWKTYGHWNNIGDIPFWTHYEFDSISEARTWLHTNNGSQRKWKVVEVQKNGNII